MSAPPSCMSSVWPSTRQSTRAVGRPTVRMSEMRLKAENDRFQAEVALLKEEIRIKDARLLRWDPRKRPRFKTVVVACVTGFS